MFINDISINNLLNEKKLSKDNVQSIKFDYANIQSIMITNPLINIQYLSLKNNLLTNISFISFFPMLLYLDVTNNSIESFDILNKYNTYGYLGLTAPHHFLDKKILSIKNLNVAILYIEIRNEDHWSIFTKNNPNIMFYHCPNKDIDFTFNTVLHKSTQPIPSIVDNNPQNTLLKELISFIRDFNKKVYDTQHNVSTKLSLKTIQQYEQKRLLIISKYSGEISKYIVNHNEGRLSVYPKFFNHKAVPLQKEKNIFYYIDILRVRPIHIQMIVQSIVYLYIIGICSKDMSVELLYQCYMKYKIIPDDDDNSSLRKRLKYFFDLQYYLIVCFYYEINQHFIMLYKEIKTSKDPINHNTIDYGIANFKELRKSLKMLKMTTEINSLKIHHLSIDEAFNKPVINNKSDIIHSLIIKYLHMHNLFTETLLVLQFVNDFIILTRNGETIGDNVSFDYCLFHEIKEQMYKSIKRDENSLAEQKYFEIKKKGMCNKFYIKTAKFKSYDTRSVKANKLFQIVKPSYKEWKKTYLRLNEINLEEEDINTSRINLEGMKLNIKHEVKENKNIKHEGTSTVNNPENLNYMSSYSHRTKGQSSFNMKGNVKKRTLNKSLSNHYMNSLNSKLTTNRDLYVNLSQSSIDVLPTIRGKHHNRSQEIIHPKKINKYTEKDRYFLLKAKLLAIKKKRLEDIEKSSFHSLSKINMHVFSINI